MIKTLLEKILNWIFVTHCCFCYDTKENSLLCSKCREKIKFLAYEPSFVIENCEVYSVCLYENVMKKLIHLVKYHHKTKLAVLQSQIMFEYWSKLNKNEKYLVIPVPMHKKRQKERGTNHMDIVVQEFCNLTNYPFRLDLLSRIKDTKPQYKLTKTEREKNLKDAFEILNDIEDKSTPLLIVDDIKTTGTTLREIILVLKKHGYTNITGFTTART